MAKNGFHSLPVVNSDDHLIGIVTTTDLMHGCLHGSKHGATNPEGELTATNAFDSRLAAALTKAREVVASKADQHGIAAALLLVQPRLSALKLIAHEAKRYLSAGQDERLHTALQNAIEQADQLDGQSARPLLGLGGE
jgi:CBS domain containing-hemolysin-like protein